MRTGERPLRKLRVVGAVAVELSSTALTPRAPRYVEACSRRRSQNNVASLRASLRSSLRASLRASLSRRMHGA